MHVTLLRDGTSNVSIEGSAYEYSGEKFAAAAQALLGSALEDKRRRVTAGPTALRT